MKRIGLTSTRKGLLAAILAPILLFVALGSWSVASPAGASPDDNFHLASIWCGDGLRPGLCESGVNPDWRLIPKALADSYCFAFKGDLSAACQTSAVTSYSTTLTPTSHGNWSGAYPPVFYALMGLLAGNNVAVSIVLMRLVNAALFIGLSTWLFFLLPRSRRTALVASLAVTVVPLGMFLIPSNNPSSWAVISAGTLWISLLGYFETTGRRKTSLGVVAVLATVMGASARADAAIYAIVAILAVTVLKMNVRRRFLVSFLLPLGLALVAAFFYFSAGQASFATSGLPSDAPPDPHRSSQYLLFINFLNVPELWAGTLGLGNLGWMDTHLPAIVAVIGVGVYCAITFTGLRYMSRRKAIAIAGVLAALWLVPLFVLLQSKAIVGEQVQPRYVLPLVILLAGISLVQRSGAPLNITRSQTTVVVAGLGVANSVALHFNIRRYVTGLDVVGWNLNVQPEWWWQGAPSPMAVWAIGTIAFAAALAILAVQFHASYTTPNLSVQTAPVAVRDKKPR
ncbi:MULTISPECIES: DUF2142 domain-containing protein [unclassified Cryobacterium]|uniref:DUF2142 domain-containing protein n=1 Tax=unclassified Cryobacterium TaxID=2649013 RepID=UPI002AB5040B|nr:MULTISPECIES: DUF2142 domain-containing protein [unclassified Cryobacterium]MDY7526676.1 DUF2142 domain-containing protein [Cryobacterium sp. 10C2]MDY7557519.1 DUF2142 domain-containing protein [Cryobacterium sp. 10C3]MEB0292021.1 DUF2142 domain-containing protein [Cryobacterium sp. 10C2]